VQPQTPTTAPYADIDAIDAHDPSPQSTLTTWVLGLLFALVISWLPAASETTPPQTGAVQVVEQQHPAPTTGLSMCLAPGQGGDTRARAY
jgi:hypothetical protein